MAKNLPTRKKTVEELEEQLSIKQQQVAEAYVDNQMAVEGKMTDQQISEEYGIVRKTLYNWRKEPAFISYMQALADKKLSASRSTADSQLLSLIRGDHSNGAPSIKALELYYRLEQRLVERQVISADLYASNEPRMSREELSDRIKGLDDIIDE